MTALATRSQPITGLPAIFVYTVTPPSGEYGRGACEHETNEVRDCPCTEFTGRGVICQTPDCGHVLGMHHKDAEDS